MRYHTQAFQHSPSDNIYGDCYRTVLACMLDLERDSVPHYADSIDPEEWKNRIQPKYNEWLRDHGLQELVLPFNCSLEDVLEWQRSMTVFASRCMLVGLSSTGCNHVVVVYDGKIEHDTSINQSGIVGPCNTGCYYLVWLIPVTE